MGRFITILSVSLLLILCQTATVVSQSPNLGLYFDPEGQSLDGMPPSSTVFETYLILKDAKYGVTGVEFQLLTPDEPTHALLAIVDILFPQENTLWLGDPWSGMAIAYWPPLNGFAEDHLLLLTLRCFLTEPCLCQGGSLTDFPILVGPHPESGELRGTCAPNHEIFSIMGLTSVMCPYPWWPLLYNVIVTAEDEIVAAFGSCSGISDASAEDESRYLVIEKVSPLDTLTVINASRHSSHSVRLTLERPMTDRTYYTFIATNICEVYDCTCSDHEWDYYYSLSIGTVLQSYAAERNSTGIVITWRMADIGYGVEFRVLRAEVDHGYFTNVTSPAIEREGLEFRFTDRDVEPGRTYRYRIEFIEDGVSNFLFETEPIEIPALQLMLYQNVPNPFNPSTTIRYYLPEKCRVSLHLYDITGKQIVCLANEEQSEGYHSVDWYGRDAEDARVVSGIYFYRLQAGKTTITKKMVLLR